MELIRTNELTKQFANVKAVDQLTWFVPENSLSGLLGPNGAGKTTTIKMLLGMIRPTSGSGSILGFDICNQSVDIRRQSALVSEEKMLYDSMTTGQFIRYYSSFFPEWSESVINEILRAWQLPLNQKIKHLSKGTRTKLWLSVAMARKPRILFLDEPTEGLDPASQEDILGLLTHWLSGAGRSAVIASHRLEEIERVCDRVTILNRGKLMIHAELEEMRSNWKTIEIAGELPHDLLTDGIVQVTKIGVVSRVITNRFPEFMKQLQKTEKQPLHIYDMNLRDIYLSTMRQGGIDYDSLENMV